MDVSVLKAKIVSKTFEHFLIFTGDEWKVQEIYIKQIARAAGVTAKRIDSITDIYQQLQRHSAFTNNKNVYVVRDDAELIKNEKIYTTIEDVLQDSILILLLTSVDKRTKFYNAFKERITVFEPLSETVLKKYVQKEITLSERNIERLMSICENDYGRILLEVDKIQRYAQSTAINKSDINYDAYFNRLLEDGTIHKSADSTVFEFVDAVLNKDAEKSYRCYNECADNNVLGTLALLYNNVRALLQVQTCESANVAKATGLNGWQIKNVRSAVGKRSVEALLNLLKDIRKVDTGIKTGKIETDVAIDYILVRNL